MEKVESFTLIELMVVVAIIAFLAGITIPRYTRYILKAKAAEVAMILASLHTAQQMYWAENGTYTTNLAQKLKWKPENLDCTCGFYFSDAQQNVNYFVGKHKTPPSALGSCHANQNSFLAKAAYGKEVWSIDESRNIKHATA